jgi:hypothetical protein
MMALAGVLQLSEAWPQEITHTSLPLTALGPVAGGCVNVPLYTSANTLAGVPTPATAVEEVVFVPDEAEVVEVDLLELEEDVDEDEQAETTRANTIPMITGSSHDLPRTCIHPLR